jgi:glycerophosphoryl diester phosphodiesterase
MRITPTGPGPGRPLIYGHRGASGDERANTVAAYALAIAQGADGVELDVRLTKDRILMIHHDDHEGDLGPFSQLPFAEIRDTDPDIPTLDEAWHAIGDTAFMNIEIKSEAPASDEHTPAYLADRVAAWIAANRATDRVLVSSFDPRITARVHATAPAVATGQLAVPSRDAELVISEAARVGHRTVNLSLAHMLEDPAAVVSSANDAALGVLVWTVNEPEDAASLAEAGVAGIFTDVPRSMVELFAQE